MRSLNRKIKIKIKTHIQKIIARHKKALLTPTGHLVLLVRKKNDEMTM